MMETLSLANQVGEFMPPHIQPWMTWMSIILVPVTLLFAIKYKAARVMVLAQILTIAGAILIFWAQGHTITKLLGIVHILWILPLIMFIRDVRSDKWVPYRIYAGLAAATILISLVFDAKDVAQFLMGDTGSILVGVPEGHLLHR